jgi:hypothetical protein
MDRQNEAVELVVESSAAKFAIEHTRIETPVLQRVTHWAAVVAAVLLVVVLVLSAVDLKRGHAPWSFAMLLLGMSLGISGALLRKPRWRISLSIASLTATLVAASRLIGGR